MSGITKDELEALAAVLHRFNAKADALLGAGTNSNSTINVHGANAWQMTACLVAAVFGVAFGSFGLYIAHDTREAQRIDAMELRNDIKAIRAYINAGMVKQSTQK